MVLANRTKSLQKLDSTRYFWRAFTSYTIGTQETLEQRSSNEYPHTRVYMYNMYSRLALESDFARNSKVDPVGHPWPSISDRTLSAFDMWRRCGPSSWSLRILYVCVLYVCAASRWHIPWGYHSQIRTSKSLHHICIHHQVKFAKLAPPPPSPPSFVLFSCFSHPLVVIW